MVIFMSSPRALVFPIQTASGVPSKKQTQTTKETIVEQTAKENVRKLHAHLLNSLQFRQDLLAKYKKYWYVKNVSTQSKQQLQNTVQ